MSKYVRFRLLFSAIILNFFWFCRFWAMIHVTTGPQNAQLCSYWTTRSVCKFTTPFPAQPRPNSNDCANHIVHLACQTTYEAWLIQQANLLITFVYEVWQNFRWHQRFFRHHIYKLGTFQGMLQNPVSSPLIYVKPNLNSEQGKTSATQHQFVCQLSYKPLIFDYSYRNTL